MAAPSGWVSPPWRALSRRQLYLGLPGNAAMALLLVVGTLWTFKWYMPGLVVLLAAWPIGAAITKYDNWGPEVLVARIRMPTSLKVA
jgi:Type IV secretory pathway, VirB3-like protein